LTILYLGIFGLSLLLAFVLTRNVRNVAIAHGWVSNPSQERHLHRDPLPRLGGVAIFLAFGISLLIAWLVAGVGLLASRQRWPAAVLLTAIVTRTFALAWAYLPEGRYILEVVPAAIVLVCVAAALAIARFRRSEVIKSG